MIGECVDGGGGVVTCDIDEEWSVVGECVVDGVGGGVFNEVEVGTKVVVVGVGSTR